MISKRKKKVGGHTQWPGALEHFLRSTGISVLCVIWSYLRVNKLFCHSTENTIVSCLIISATSLWPSALPAYCPSEV